MRRFSQFLIALLVFGLATVLMAQDKPKLKVVSPTKTSPSSGSEMFRSYCAACHGLDGKGNGPAVPALKTSPGDMTLLAKNNGGKFPELKIFNTIRGEVGFAAHGSKDMPLWGDVFREMGRDATQVTLRIRNLTKYIESLQK